ncbi:hypothetical protein [Rhodococcus opacus]|uniref:hypothetical protein n=1 Tax=Rhodococcus opacus TaxID=37919 RepID=UPI0006BB46F3|nr:hypothetical protein [Rhodococcus opacus]
MTPERRRQLALAARILLAVAAALVLALQALSQAKIFENPTWLPVVLGLAVAFLTLSDNARAAVRTARAPQRENAHMRVQKAAIAAVIEISKTTGVELEVIGGSVFTVHKRIAWKKSLKCVRLQNALTRPVRFRVQDYPQASTVKWLSGKGAIGETLRHRSYAYIHWAPIAKRHGGPPPITREKFAAIQTGTRAGFTYKEFVGIVQKYAEILAVPIMSEDGAKILGVFAIDRPYVPGDNSKRFDDSVVRGIAEVAAVAMRGDL